MSTDDDDSKPAKPDYDPMENVIERARIELVYTNERTERHMMPTDHPPTPHVADEMCWCEPELVHKTKRWSIYRHKRQQ